MLFRSADIETVPDYSFWKPGDPRWSVRPVSRVDVEAASAIEVNVGGTWGKVTGGDGRWLPYDVGLGKDEPFPPPQANRVVAVAWCDVLLERNEKRVDRDGKAFRTYKFKNYSASASWAAPGDARACRNAERELVARFGAEQVANPATIITWNGRTFDLPVLSLRALHLGISWQWYYAERGTRYRYSDEGHCDLMDVLSDYGASRYPAMGDVARLVGLPGKTDMDGSKVADVVSRGEIRENMDRIAAYCGHDALQTAVIFLRTRYHMGLLTAEGYEESLESFRGIVGETGLSVKWEKLSL